MFRRSSRPCTNSYSTHLLALLLFFFFSKNSAFLAAIMAGFSGFLQRKCRCPVRPQFQKERYGSDPENSFFVILLAYFGALKGIVGFDPDKVERLALQLVPLLANTSSCICKALASWVWSSRNWAFFPILYRYCLAQYSLSSALRRKSTLFDAFRKSWGHRRILASIVATKSWHYLSSVAIKFVNYVLEL